MNIKTVAGTVAGISLALIGAWIVFGRRGSDKAVMESAFRERMDELETDAERGTIDPQLYAGEYHTLKEAVK